MAFGAKRIFPIDTKPGTGVGIAIPFNAPAVFKTTYTTKDAVRNNLINFFLTNKTERYLNSNFGANLRAFVFEQITSGNLDFLKQDIQAQLTAFFPNVLVQDLEVTGNPDTYEATVILTYNIVNTGINDEISITFT
jgi:phage baseplate assembly protein W